MYISPVNSMFNKLHNKKMSQKFGFISFIYTGVPKSAAS